MTERAKNITQILNLVASVDSYTLQSYQDTLILSENLREFESKSPHKPPFAINYLEYYDSHEPVTSWIIRHIFAYSQNGNHPFFESFARKFLTKIGFQMNWIKCPIIDKDHEYRNIDILVRESKYAVIIENKLKGAGFQLNQIARYIATMREEGYLDEQIFVVILPKFDIDNGQIPQSVWLLPSDWKSINTARKCRVDDHTCECDYNYYKPKEHCKNCESLWERFKPRTIFIHKDFSSWLQGCVIEDKVAIKSQYVLISAILQFIDFLNSLYGTRENYKFKMSILKFLNNQLKLDGLQIEEQMISIQDKIKEVKELDSHLSQLLDQKSKALIKEMREKYNIPFLPNEKDGWYFSCNISIGGEIIKVILDKETNAPYCEIDAVSSQDLPECIKNDYDITIELNDKDNRPDAIWRYGTYEESLLRFDRMLRRVLDIKKQVEQANN